ncbi:MAG: nuclear transport factor 2 family protein [Aquaticitalea sp.]
MKTSPIISLFVLVMTYNFVQAQTKEELKKEVWQMEEQYWDYVQKNDTISYKKLWHDDFMGYPSFIDDVSDKSKIANWIPKLHEDPNLTFNYQLYKKGVNAIDDVVIVFYDADEIWTDKLNTVVKKERLKFTHTWKKYGNTWLILGGMAGKKE